MIGVVGSDSTLTDRVVATVRAAGAAPRTATPDTLVAEEPDAVVAVGEATVIALARTGLTAPVLPVDAGRGLESVPRDRIETAVERFVADEFEVRHHPIVEVRVGDERVARALYDVMLVTSEPARISEYTIVTDAGRVTQFRADGVVAAMPAGSYGYARAAGGPLLTPGTDAVAVVPVSAFATQVDQWVFDLTMSVRLRVERDEGDVSLLVDDRTVQQVPYDVSVALDPADRFRVAVTTERRR